MSGPGNNQGEVPGDAGYVSEFLSETSDELKAMRAAREAASPPPPFGQTGRARAAVATRRVWWSLALVGVVGAAAIAFVAMPSRSAAPVVPAAAAAPPPTSEGTARIVSRPEGAEIFIDGTRHGVAPLELKLPAGSYTLELRNGGASRTLPLTIEASTSTRELVDLAPAPVLGRLEVGSDMAGARVAVDGVIRGVTPLVLTDIEPGERQLAIRSGESVVYRNVNIEAGATASVFASLPRAGVAGGWLSISAPIELQVLERGQVIGTTGAARMMMPAGRHELELFSEPFEFRTTVSVDVPAGGTVPVAVPVPSGRLSINAVPWAEVWMNGQPLGTTPLANLPTVVGDHVVVWRHPQFGERRQTVRVTARTPARAGVDFGN